MKTFILPGMGADSRMYSHPAYKRLKNINFVNWPVYNNETTILEIATNVIRNSDIPSKSIVGGSSLGGIVAAEIAKQINVKSLVLIGSSRTPDSVNGILKKLSNFSNFAPVELIQFLAGKNTLFAENLVIEMFQETDPAFIKNMSKAIFEWEGNVKPNCNVYAIHGKNDTVINPPKENVTLVNGGHLIAITHANEVASFIAKCLL